MSLRTAVLLLSAGLVLPLAACSSSPSSSKPTPALLTDDAVGHYDQMYLVDHAGPKAQIVERGQSGPIWFVQVTDAITYLHEKERAGDVQAVYVTDMGRAPSWAEPGRDNWVDADAAWFVIGSAQMGGMLTPEAIPFGDRGAADAFVDKEGGRVARLADIPASYAQPPADPGAMVGMK